MLLSMVLSCVCGGCSNTRYNPAVALFSFPKDAATARKWYKFVCETRVWNTSFEKAFNSRAVICSDHFEDECFDRSALYKFEMQVSRIRLRLVRNAVPTITKSYAQRLNEERGVLVKNATRGKPVKKVAQARLKASCKRPAAEAEVSRTPVTSASPPLLGSHSSSPSSFSSPSPLRISPQLQSSPLDLRKRGTDESPRLTKVKEALPFDPSAPRHTCHMETQTEITMCHMLQLDRLRDSVETPAQTCLIPKSEPCEQVDTTPLMEAVSEEGIVVKEEEGSSLSEASGSLYVPSTSHGSCPEQMKRTSGNKTSDWVFKNEDRKYLVFESALLDLLSTCRTCKSVAEPHIVKFLGTFVHIGQVCSKNTCKGYTWDSQLMHGNMPLV